MNEPRRILVDAASAGQRLDRFLVGRADIVSRSQIQRRIAADAVRIDGVAVKAGALVRAGQVIEIDPPPAADLSRVEAQEIALDVLFEDDCLLIINKPPGLVVHPAPGNWQGTLVSALLHHWGGARPGLDAVRPGIVHRLDKDTSGVLVIAKDAATLADLAAQFHDRLVEKQYLAIVWGRMARACGTIREPIGRNPVHRKQMTIRRGGRSAETRFRVVERFATVTVVRLLPQTGRTHQLRVHLASIGHPIVGDSTYGGARGRSGDAKIARQALHAERLAFRHPRRGEPMSFTASLPSDMVCLIEACRAEVAR